MASVYFGAGKLLILLGIMVDRIGQVLRLYCAFERIVKNYGEQCLIKKNYGGQTR